MNTFKSSCEEILKNKVWAEYELARRHVINYAQMQYPNYRVAKHNLAIAGALDDVSNGKCDRLMIFAPPRHGKSMLTSQAFPAFYLGKYPDRYIIHTTYNDELAGDFGSKIRNQIITSPFKEIFPECSTFGRSKSQSKIETVKGGVYYSVGVGGAITGRGAHLFIIDDPIKGRADADSDTIREKLKSWYESVAYTRLMPGGAIVIIQTRWHYDDLSGWLLGKDKLNKRWRIVNLPAIAEEDDMLGRKPGEALWPTDFPIETLKEIRDEIGSREFDCLYQQQPSSVENALIKMSWFGLYENLPEDINFRVQSWDTANNDKPNNDISVMHHYGTNNINYYLIDRFGERLQFPDLVRACISLYERDKPNAVLIENKASGQQLIQTLKRITNMPIIPVTPTKKDSKIDRAKGVSATIEAGKVFIPRYTFWRNDFDSQIMQFPFGAHDDDVDAMSQGLRYLIDLSSVKTDNDIKGLEIPKIYDM